MSEEKMKILQMVQESKISTEEAMELLKAIEEEDQTIKVPRTDLKGKFLRIHVVEEDDTVNVKIPLTVVEAGMKLAGKFDFGAHTEALRGIDIEEVLNMVRQGAEGKILEVETENELVTIYVD